MNNGLLSFDHDGATIRTLTVEGEPYFVARDVAEILGYSNYRDAIARHCKGVVKHDTPTVGGMQELTYIPERDVYRLVMRSKLPSAERFEEWVVGTVLPSIRKSGSYVVQPAFRVPRTLGEALRLAADLEEKRAALENENREQAKLIEYHKPDVQFAEAMRASDDLITFDEVAKTLSKIKPIGHINLRRALRDCGILRKDNGLPMQKYVNNGLLAVVQSTWTTPDGEVKINRKVMATGSGMQALTTWYSKYIETVPRTLRKGS
ncbi:BRO family protein [Burkholderia contaminans]|uniref:BRO family protein n=1 Tax=Burkholderia contaminans TaxID=488447 RepID=UPI001FC7F87D|nr:BRO family protein [Burkholderia contaminans]